MLAVGPAVMLALAPLNATMHNFGVRELNRTALENAGALAPLAKEVAGAGVGGIFGALPGAYIAAAVGAAAPPHFPANIAGIQNLTAQHICRIARYYNNSFGIVAADNLIARRAKFMTFLFYHS